MNRFLLVPFFIGAIVGMFALPFQYVIHGMEAPNFTWFFKVPFLTFCFGVISAGFVGICLVLISGILELIDPNKHWPHQ